MSNPYMKGLREIKLMLKYESIATRKNLPVTHPDVKGYLDSAEILVTEAIRVAKLELYPRSKSK